jgi:hypothetical protein
MGNTRKPKRINVTKFHNGCAFLTKRETEFTDDPVNFESRYGPNYARQMRYRVRNKIRQALMDVEAIINRMNQDEAYWMAITKGDKSVYDAICWFLEEIYYNIGSKWKF